MTLSSMPHQRQFVKNNTVQTFVPPYQSILQSIDSYSRKQPDKEAIIGMNEDCRDAPAISYKNLAEILRQSCDFFHDTLELKPGDAISVLMENETELLVINWAAWSSGLRTVPLDTKRDTLERKLYKLRLTEAKVLFVRTDQVDEKETRRLKKKLPSVRIIELSKEGQYFENVANSRESTERSGNKRNLFDTPLDLDCDCLILFTSGTTSLPKGVRLTPRSLWANAAQIIHWLKITEDDRFHILLPLHHINSTTFSLATILAGGTVILSPRYSKSKFWKIMADKSATLSSIVPTIAYDLLSEQEAFKKNKSRLRQVSRIQLGSAPVQASVVLKFYSQYKIPLIQGYGSTETSLRCTGIPYGLPENDYLAIAQSNTIGAEMLYNNVAVLDEHCRETAEGEDGEICIRGPVVTQGYLNDFEETEKAFLGGWFHSGDLGYWKQMYGQNMFFIKGRLKEIIIKGGVNISPLAIENAILKAFPAIEFCYALGFPQTRFGEEIGVIVNGTQQGLDTLQKAIEKRQIPSLKAYECPVVFLTVERRDLPRTSTGKIQRVIARQRYSHELCRTFSKSGGLSALGANGRK